MKILLLGTNGQVGWELQKTLPSLGDVKACTRADLDLTDFDAIRATIAGYQPDIIINAAAYTAVDKAESEPELAHRINAEAVGVLAEEAKRLDTWLIHYSTDYVFDGTKTEPYTETAPPNPINVYGQSKLAGERAIEKSGCKHLIFRTTWVIGTYGNNFVKTILRLAKERDSLNVVADQHGAPTSAALIADVTAQAIQAILNGRLPSGIYHLAPSGYTTWHELAQHVVSRARQNGMPLRLNPEQIKAIPTADYPTPAKRPANSRLDTLQLAKSLGITLPKWKMHVGQIVDHISGQEVSS